MSVNNCSNNPKFLPWVAFKWTQGESGIAEVKAKFGESFNLEDILSAEEIAQGETVEFSQISDIDENRPQISSEVIITEKDLVRSRLKKELTECAVCKLTDKGVEYYSNHSQRDITIRVNQLKLKYIIEIATKAHLPMGYEYNNQSLTFTDAIERLAITDPKEQMTPLEKENLDEAVTTLLTEFISLYENASVDKQKTLKDAYVAYYTVTNLDKFATEFSDILQPVKDNPDSLLGQEYKYSGPRSKHLSGYNREDSPVSEILGELQKAVLDYLPQVDSKGHIINSSSIGWNNFLANGLMLRQWAIHEGLEEIYKPEGQIDYQNIYEKYMTALRAQKVPTEFIVPTPEALNGMSRFIFDRKNNEAMDEELYFGFMTALSKYIRSNYIEYVEEEGQLILKPLTERFVTLQKLLLENRQKATKALFKKMLSEDNRNPSVLRKQRIPESLEFINDKRIIWTVNGKEINLLHSTAASRINDGDTVEQFMLLFNKVMGVEWDYNKLDTINKQLNTKVSLVKMLLNYMLPVISNDSSTSQTIGTLSRIYSLFSGSVSKSVIKNSEGNNLPTYQLGSYAYKLPQRARQVKTLTPYANNIVVNNTNAVGIPFLRNSVSKEGRITTSSALTAKEAQYLSIVEDFAQMLNKDNSLSSGQSKNKGTILVQPTVFSDKNTHYLLPINLKKIKCQINGQESTWFNALTWICTESKTHSKQAKNIVLENIQSSLHNYYKQIIDNIVADYKEVYPNHAAWTTSEGNEVDPVTAINAIIKDKQSALITDFAQKGKTCVEFAHYSGDLSEGSAGFNKELVEMETNTSPEKFQEWINNEFEVFKESLSEKMQTQIKENLPAGYKLEGTLWAYYMSDLLFSHDYNAVMVGSFTSHKGKNSSARWIAATKRMVIYGATVHSLAQGLVNGVPQKIKVACVEDIKSFAPLMTGVLGKGDANDGSGYVHPIYSRLANYSYLDGKGGANKKTIFGDMHDKYGVPILLKWAEYEITNERRRQGFNSSNSPESLLKKMSDTSLDFNVLTKDLEYTPENLYYSREVYENGIPNLQYFKINTIKINGNQLLLTVTPSNHSGNPTADSIDLDPITLENIWQLDQALGGCWCYTKESGTLLPSEANQDLITQIAIDLTSNGVDVKSNITSYVINHSAIKVGAANINPNRVFEKDNEESLMTFSLDTRYGGMQLNSEHAIEDSDVTEVSQMISALEQLGFTHDKASKVYWDIAKAVEVSLSDLPSILGTKVQDLSPDILQKYYQVFTDAFIDSFKRNQRDTMGLAQAFIAKAETLLEQYRIPFSAGTLYGIFGSIITSDYVKRAIRRHYSGIGAVLVPTHNSKMLYHINGQYYTYPEIRSKIHTLVGPDISNQLLTLYSEGITEKDLFTLSRVLPNGKNNPTVVSIDNEELSQLSIGDTVIISSDDDPNHDQVMIIDDVLKLHICKSKSGKIFKSLLAPHNLSGPILTWQETRSNKDSEQVIIQQSIYDYTEEVEFIERDDEGNEIITEETINVPLTLAYLYNLNKGDSINKAINDGTIDSIFMSSVGEMADINLARVIRNTIDHFDPEGSELSTVSDLLVVMTKSLQGKLNILSKLTEDSEVKVNYKPAQIILGKLFTKQFGIKKGMTLNQCNESFFIGQIRNQMNQDFRVIKEIGAINGCPIRGMIYGSDNKPIYIVENSSGEPITFQNKRNSKYTLDKEKLLGPSTEIFIEGANDAYKVTVNGTSFDVIEVTTSDQAQNLLTQLEESLSFTRGLYIPKPTIESLKYPLYVEQEQQLQNISQEFGLQKFKDFQKSLNMIGARIPCQNMTSFMSMEVVGFSDSETNEVYLPTIVNILQGSDFDIDKQYILGYTVLPDGRILEGDLDSYKNLSPYIKDAITKNNVISGAQSIVRDPANQINLSMPVEMDEVASLAAKADDRQGKLSPFNPMSKYVLQEQNMIGKQVIGIMATGIKSFFALTGVYNDKMNIFASKLAASNPAQWEELEKDLDKMVQWDSTSEEPKVQYMLANINIDNLRSAWKLCIDNLDIGAYFIYSSLSRKIAAIINFQEGLPDVSQSLGQLLNAATDNAKHLYLKKINCDNEWAGIYAYALMIGMPLNKIGDLMISDAFNNFLAAQESNLFEGSFINKKRALKNYIDTLENDADKIKLIPIYNLCDGAENLKTLGRALKINQGLQVKDEDSYRMLHQIEQGLGINLERFLSDDDYKQEKVSEGDKNIINVHLVLANSPHFNAMLKAFVYDRKTKAILAKRSALIQYIENHNGHGDLKYDNRNWTITEKGYKDLREDVNAFFINHFLTKRKRPILRFPKGYRYSYNFKSYQSNGSSELLIGDNRSIAIFKEYIEQHFIPSVKNHWPDNIFVQELFYDHVNGDYFYNLPIDLTKATSAESTRRKFREYQRAFNAIKDQRFANDGLYVDGNLLTIGDTIMLYNLLVHKDKINGHSLTPLFEDSVVESAMSGQNNLMTEYNEYIDGLDYDVIYADFIKWKANSASTEAFYEAKEGTNLDKVIDFNDSTLAWLTEIKESLISEDFVDQLQSKTNIEDIVELYVRWIDENPELVNQLLAYAKTYRKNAFIVGELPINIEAFSEALNKSNEVLSEIVETIYLDNAEIPIEDAITGRTYILKTASINVKGEVVSKKCLFSRSDDGTESLAYYPTDWEFKQIMARHLRSKQLAAQMYIGEYSCWILFTPEGKVNKIVNSITGTELETNDKKAIQLVKDTMSLANQQLNYLSVENMAKNSGNTIQILNKSEDLPEEAANELAFVDKGVIYINKNAFKSTWKAKYADHKANVAVIHELAHLLLGHSIWNKSQKSDTDFIEKYSELRGKILDTAKAYELRSNEVYKNLSNYDLAEELIATLISKWYSNSGILTTEELQLIKDIFNVFDDLNKNLVTLINDTERQDDTLLKTVSESYAEHQKLIAVRQRLADNIEENCE